MSDPREGGSTERGRHAHTDFGEWMRGRKRAWTDTGRRCARITGNHTRGCAPGPTATKHWAEQEQAALTTSALPGVDPASVQPFGNCNLRLRFLLCHLEHLCDLTDIRRSHQTITAANHTRFQNKAGCAAKQTHTSNLTSTLYLILHQDSVC